MIFAEQLLILERRQSAAVFFILSGEQRILKNFQKKFANYLFSIAK
jgi:hypothetical protein